MLENLQLWAWKLEPGPMVPTFFLYFFQALFRLLRGCLVCDFKQLFSVFKQHFTHFNALFHSHVFPQMFSNNNFQFLNTYTKRPLRAGQTSSNVKFGCQQQHRNILKWHEQALSLSLSPPTQHTHSLTLIDLLYIFILLFSWLQD